MPRPLAIGIALLAVVGTFLLGWRSSDGPAIEAVTIGQPTPSQGLKKWTAAKGWADPKRSLNESGVDKPFGHTFAIPRGCTNQAKLTVDLKPVKEELVPNDTMGFTFADSEGKLVPGTVEWAAWLGKVDDPGGLPMLVRKQWSAENYPDGYTFDLKLANLPGGTNLIDSINKAKFLDFYVQDDTIVESVDLTGCE